MAPDRTVDITQQLPRMSLTKIRHTQQKHRKSRVKGVRYNFTVIIIYEPCIILWCVVFVGEGICMSVCMDEER